MKTNIAFSFITGAVAHQENSLAPHAVLVFGGRIPDKSSDGYFRYIAESVVNAYFTEAKRNRQEAKNKCCTLLLT